MTRAPVPLCVLLRLKLGGGKLPFSRQFCQIESSRLIIKRSSCASPSHEQQQQQQLQQLQ